MLTPIIKKVIKNQKTFNCQKEEGKWVIVIAKEIYNDSKTGRIDRAYDKIKSFLFTHKSKPDIIEN